MLRLLVSALVLLWYLPLRAEITVDISFEGASAHIETIDQTKKTIRFRPAGKADRGWPCWWFLKVEGLPVGEFVTLELTRADDRIPQDGPYFGKPLPAEWSMPKQAAWSADGRKWHRTETGQRSGDVMKYRHKATAK